ncbi:hypothetical protein CALCODRAFT_497775 [Calocera cornea HHB12733]|uniref:EF-hand domain-containing protein n=1 Tax=Calocera cornea HHB12733 TaxID=1353952 RepID=A0A165F346_9BASI|nr:hypothetical protein CALCODRAFT_497775 [Calocera cornea HHB12733]
MKTAICAVLLAALLKAASAHGDHGQEGQEGEGHDNYAARHMAKEHHIDDFDMESFFHLHDLDRNLYLTVDEIEAIYGVHHEISKKHESSKDDDAHDEKARTIVKSVLAAMDKDGDGMISLKEFVEAGPAGLPDFASLGADGHHYDGESEYFLHHEEIYHSTPETQTDESYTHPEDIEHFMNHEAIEIEEENRERKFQGLPPLDENGNPPPEEVAEREAAAAAAAANEGVGEAEAEAEGKEDVPQQEGGQQVLAEGGSGGKRFERGKKEPPASEKFKGAAEAAAEKGHWGEGEGGFKPPRTPAERLRRNLPYKYKFRRSWSDF